MRAYELMVIIDGDLDADQAQAQVQSIEGRCNEAGMVASTDFWGRRTFAYEIDHKTEGSYVVYEILAEPGALICFAGPRVIEQTIREKLPKGFQRSEYLYDHGMVDMVVHRHSLRPTIGQLLTILTKAPAPAELAGVTQVVGAGLPL